MDEIMTLHDILINWDNFLGTAAYDSFYRSYRTLLGFFGELEALVFDFFFIGDVKTLEIGLFGNSINL